LNDTTLRPAETSAGRSAAAFFVRYGLVIALVVMELGFAIVEPLVLSPGNLLNVLQQTTYIAVFAAAQMVVILTRGFDLSLGTCVSSVSVASALVMTSMVAADPGSLPSALAMGVLTGIGLGIAVGLFNGFCISVLNVNAFVTTLGSFNICFGIATTISDGRPVFDVPKEFSELLYSGTILGVPAPVIIAVAVLAGLHLLLNGTVFGRSLYIIGGNPRAATLAGLPTRRYLVVAYVLCSLLAAVGALMIRRAEPRRKRDPPEHCRRGDRRGESARRRREHLCRSARRGVRDRPVQLHGARAHRRLHPADHPGLRDHRRHLCRSPEDRGAVGRRA
jgi:ribose transport system permease protein